MLGIGLIHGEPVGEHGIGDARTRTREAEPAVNGDIQTAVLRGQIGVMTVVRINRGVKPVATQCLEHLPGVTVDETRAVVLQAKVHAAVFGHGQPIGQQGVEALVVSAGPAIVVQLFPCADTLSIHAAIVTGEKADTPVRCAGLIRGWNPDAVVLVRVRGRARQR